MIMGTTAVEELQLEVAQKIAVIQQDLLACQDRH
jgi:hypothetical protein